MERIIDTLARRYRDFEVYEETVRSVDIERSGDGTRDTATTRRDWAVRVFSDGRCGFASCSGEPDPAAVVRNIEWSLANSFADDDNILPDPGYRDGVLFGTACEPDRVRMREIVVIPGDVLGDVAHVKAIERSSASCRIASSRLYNSRCGIAGQAACKYSAGLTIVVAGDADEKLEWEFGSNDRIEELDMAAMARTASARGARLLGSEPVATGRYPVVFENRAACEFIEVFSSSFTGENVYKKRSLLDEGRSFSPLIEIADWPLLPAGSTAYHLDGDGVPARKTMLLAAGRQAGLLLDSFYGRKLGRPSTGNAIRGGTASPPKNGASNIMLTAAHQPGLAGALPAIETAVVVSSVMGMHLVNAVSGEFSVGFEGWLLHRGEPGRAVGRTTIAGNLAALFTDVAAIGDDDAQYGACGSPSLLVEGLTVSGS